MLRVSYHIIMDLLKSRVVIGYLLLLITIGWGIFWLESQPEKALLVLLQVTLLLIPVTTMVFTSIYYYNALEFILLLLAQPLRRSTIYNSLFISLTGSLMLGFVLGIAIPLLWFNSSLSSLFLTLGGLLLILIFTALSLLVSISNRDKARGLGISLVIWAVFAILFDGLVLLIMYQLADYPIETPVLILSLFNPIDISRILVIMQTDASAMLGLSGAVFKDFFGSTMGIIISIAMLFLWAVIPNYIAKYRFMNKDM